MIKINLIPPEIHAAEMRKQLNVAGGALGGLVVLSMLGFWGTRLMKANQLEKDLRKAKEELTKYQAIVDKVNQLEATRNQLQARRDVIQRLLKGRLTYPHFFEDFMSLLPAEIWIDDLTTASAEDALNVTVSAQSLSNFAIADWLTNLQKSPMCSNVVLGTISATETEGSPATLSFQMTFRYVRATP